MAGDSKATTPPSAGKSPACTLPSDKVFSIQIGSELFRLSGASIASDAPSYFSRFFEEQLRLVDASNVRTLYIDRDPATFQDIARHLQGYHVRPRDGAQFVKLFADAQFYTCQIPRPINPQFCDRVRADPTTVPRLMSQLFESEIFIQIGDRHFQIPRDIFSGPGDSPNFFSLGFGAFFASPSEVFPGLDRVGLLRPPAIIPPSVPNRSADVFAELLHLLRGYPLHIRNADHRAELLRDCRYFHLRGLEQKLIPHHISYNPFRQRSEIVIRLEDVRPSGVQFAPDTTSRTGVGSVLYARPFVDENPADLILEIADASTLVNRAARRADFVGLTKSRMASLLQVVAKKMGLPDSKFGTIPIRVRWGQATDIVVDGESNPTCPANFAPDLETDDDLPPAKRHRSDASEGSYSEPCVVRTGQWRLQVEADNNGTYEVVLIAVKLDTWTTAQVRNQYQKFL
ncbi:uncharacterized protein N7496_012139 [Penicillium cataractarum]|uniref:Potassium channel tetramerisation-type BTB domain-containing protein n=1 Tax=Penicillium cataractarum TaxID=2100454 RepID=A0A9W9UYP7_9EURO|nr:uncharacterized protein N7496_012139 [Penicillium cataractarum]KAJ5359726.1 hypothetical protein N7496_012139 [Penicillium cataractarum]